MRKKMLMKGNEAIAEAAIRAGCKFYAGYPITPQSELTEYMAKNLPEAGGVFIQAESEIAAINMIYGASAAGYRVMTSSSSPGISLKQEGISYLALAQLPTVIVNIMRGGPGLGDIQPAQSDYFQAVKGGGHGDYHTIVLAPSTVKELAVLTMLAFNLADKYRNPVMILGDGLLGQTMEPVVFPPRTKPASDKPIKLPPKKWALTGAKDRKRHTIIPFDIDARVVERMNIVLNKKYQTIKKKEVRYELVNMQSPDIIMVAYGSMGRIAKTVIKMAKKEGIEVGLIRPITLWPFPHDIIREKAEVFKKKLMVVEMSFGQMVEDVRLAVEGRTEVLFYGRTGGIVPMPEEILDEVKKALPEKGRKEEIRTKTRTLQGPQENSWIPSSFQASSPENMKSVFEIPKALSRVPFTYCSGCNHGTVHRIIAEVIDELNIKEKTIGVFCVGCAVFGPQFFDIDCIIPAHGRAPAVATGIKRVEPDKIVFAYQGDGDLGAIGIAETIYASNRGENITVIFINNATYGMTGGQMAPTTLPGQKTTTTPLGRNPKTEGNPLPICELLSVLKRPAYIARVACNSPKNIIEAKKAIKKAFQRQINEEGYSIVEVLSACPTNWKLSPLEALKWLEENMISYFPLGEFSTNNKEVDKCQKKN